MPTALTAAEAVYDPGRNRVIGFGGMTGPGEYTTQTIIYTPPLVDGSEEGTLPDGTLVTSFGSLGSLMDLFGVHIPAGSQMVENPDGSSEIRIGPGGGSLPGLGDLPEGTVVERHRYGTLEITKPDGTKVTIFGPGDPSQVDLLGDANPVSQTTELPGGGREVVVGEGGWGELPGLGDLPEGTLVKIQADGKTQIVRPDGTTVTSFGLGGVTFMLLGIDLPVSQTTEEPDGSVEVVVGEGGWGELPGWGAMPEGTLVYTFPDGTTQVIKPDRTVVMEFGPLAATAGLFGKNVPVGSRMTEHPDGSRELRLGPGGAEFPGWGVLPEGTVLKTLPDGMTQVTKPDGTPVIPVSAVGLRDSLLGTGVDLPEGTQTTDMPDGSSEIVIGPDGGELPGVGPVPGGAVVRVGPNGIVQVLKPNGAVVKALPGGTVAETRPNGTVVTTVGKDAGIPPGTKFTERPDGSIEMVVGQGGMDLPGQGLTPWPEGTVVALDVDGLVTIVKPDGTVELGQITPSMGRLFRKLQVLGYQAGLQ